ncbi:hypothetical protein Nepgr_029981 [Nepenthes gracilis]|uniref:Uncharacterized protein n=1 Tax=Nepenthes gracilis TaxID=150966 RepID=A0AAD3Y3R5_NEPGR|nr:hypothetical protein Nepgr_029981 [Nepenthes gracilis]
MVSSSSMPTSNNGSYDYLMDSNINDILTNDVVSPKFWRDDDQQSNNIGVVDYNRTSMSHSLVFLIDECVHDGAKNQGLLHKSFQDDEGFVESEYTDLEDLASLVNLVLDSF